jgi:hypothetical protein
MYLLGKEERRMAEPLTFNSLAEAIDMANFIQQLLVAEYQWINYRLSWLLISQSFCITAYAILSASTGTQFGHKTIAILQLGLPAFGIICCVLVGFAVFAATHVARSLAHERARVVLYINEKSSTTVPLPGATGELMKKGWTYWGGELPHWVLPWVLVALWLLLMIW